MQDTGISGASDRQVMTRSPVQFTERGGSMLYRRVPWWIYLIAAIYILTFGYQQSC